MIKLRSVNKWGKLYIFLYFLEITFYLWIIKMICFPAFTHLPLFFSFSSSSCLFVFYSFPRCFAFLPLVLLLCLLSCSFYLLSCSFTSCPAPLILILHSSFVVFKSEHNIFLFKRQMGDTSHSCIRPCVNALLPFPLFSSFCILLLPYLLFSSILDLFLFLFMSVSLLYLLLER